MKIKRFNHLFMLLFVALLGGILFQGCHKELDINPTSEQESTELINVVSLRDGNENITPILNNGYLSFECENTFEEFVKSDIRARSISNFTSNGFQSILENTAYIIEGEHLISDTEFGSVLNLNGIVGIGENIFKVDPINELVYSIPSYSSENDILAFTNANSNILDLDNIRVFSFNDDIFSIVESPQQPDGNPDVCARWGCKESRADEDEDQEWVDGVIDETHISWRVQYEKYGLWCRLSFRMKNKFTSFFPIWSWQELFYDVKWSSNGVKPRCRDEFFPSREYVCDVINNPVPINQLKYTCLPNKDGYVSFKIYQSTRKLHSYHLKGTLKFLELGSDTVREVGPVEISAD